MNVDGAELDLVFPGLRDRIPRRWWLKSVDLPDEVFVFLQTPEPDRVEGPNDLEPAPASLESIPSDWRGGRFGESWPASTIPMTFGWPLHPDDTSEEELAEEVTLYVPIASLWSYPVRTPNGFSYKLVEVRPGAALELASWLKLGLPHE